MKIESWTGGERGLYAPERRPGSWWGMGGFCYFILDLDLGSSRCSVWQLAVLIYSFPFRCLRFGPGGEFLLGLA